MHVKLTHILCLFTTLSMLVDTKGALYAQEATADSTGNSLRIPLRRQLAHQIGFDLRSDYVTPTSSFFEGSNGTGKPIRHVWSAHLKYAFRFNKHSGRGRLYPHAYQGIGISYNRFNNPGPIGSPIALYAFQGSRIARFSPKLSLDYEWNFGASFGWEKHDAYANRLNDVVGSRINAYLNLGFLLDWQLHSRWHLTAGVDLTHYSNGNTHYPNAGVNPIGGKIGIVHTFGSTDKDAGTTPEAHTGLLPEHPRFTYDLIVYGATRKRGFFDEEGNGYLIPGSFGIIGLNFNPMYNVNRYFRAGISLDTQYDESANLNGYYAGGSTEDPKFYRPPFREQFAAGLSARAELAMPIFSVNIGIGHNVIYHGEDTKGFYQILALKTSVTRHLFLHVGYQLSKFKNPNNLMLGIGWRFQGKSK